MDKVNKDSSIQFYGKIYTVEEFRVAFCPKKDVSIAIGAMNILVKEGKAKIVQGKQYNSTNTSEINKYEKTSAGINSTKAKVDKDSKIEFYGEIYTVEDFRIAFCSGRDEANAIGAMNILVNQGKAKLIPGKQDISKNISETNKYEKTSASNNTTISTNTDNSPYRLLSDGSYSANLAGVSIDNRQAIVKTIREGEKLNLIRDNDNSHDRFAIAVFKGINLLGYIPKELSAIIAPKMDSGMSFSCKVYKVVGGAYGKLFGVVVNLLSESQLSSSSNRSYGSPHNYNSSDSYNSSNSYKSSRSFNSCDDDPEDGSHWDSSDLKEYFGYERDDPDEVLDDCWNDD